MKTFILATAGAVALMFGASNSADAGCGYGGYGGYGGYVNYGYSPLVYSGHIHHNVSPWIDPGYGHLHWHDTSHYDYVPGGFVPHGNHFHYQPGGYILHQTGHYDLHH